MGLNALEQYLEDEKKSYQDHYGVGIGNDYHESSRVTYGDLCSFAQEHRKLEQRFQQRGERLFESSKMITIRDERIKELEAQITQREGDCCENCAHNKQLAAFRPDTHIHCSSLRYSMPKIAWCPHYTAKPKVWKCRWKYQATTNNKYTEEDAKMICGDGHLIGPVEGTWEDVEE